MASPVAAFSHCGKRTERATHYPFQRIFQNRPPDGKDRQRYPFYLTVFWFRLVCISKKTVRNTVNLCDWLSLLDALLISFVVQ